MSVLSCNVGCGDCPFALRLLCRRLLAGRTEERRHDNERYRAQINEGLEVLLQDAFGQRDVAAQLGLSLRLRVRSQDVLGHEADPLRVNSIRFLPSSTNPPSMTFGDDVRAFPEVIGDDVGLAVFHCA